MIPRSIEMLLVLLLIAFTAGVIMQFKNQQLLNDILVALEDIERTPVSAGPAAPAPQPVAPVTPQVNLVDPANPAVNPATPNPNPNPQPQPQPRPSVPVAPQPQPTTPDPEPAPSPTPAPAPAPTPVTPVTTDGSSEAWERHGALVTSIANSLISGEYDAVVAKLDPVMAKRLDKGLLGRVVDPLREQHGPIKQILGHRDKPKYDASIDTFEVDLELRDGHKLQLTISIDDLGRIAALTINDYKEAG